MDTRGPGSRHPRADPRLNLDRKRCLTTLLITRSRPSERRSPIYARRPPRSSCSARAQPASRVQPQTGTSSVSVAECPGRPPDRPRVGRRRGSTIYEANAGRAVSWPGTSRPGGAGSGESEAGTRITRQPRMRSPSRAKGRRIVARAAPSRSHGKTSRKITATSTSRCCAVISPATASCNEDSPFHPPPVSTRRCAPTTYHRPSSRRSQGASISTTGDVPQAVEIRRAA
jgi:hypothetical protein